MLWNRCFIFFSFVSSSVSFNVRIPGGNGGSGGQLGSCLAGWLGGLVLVGKWHAGPEVVLPPKQSTTSFTAETTCEQPLFLTPPAPPYCPA